MRNILNNIFIGFTLMASMLVGCNPKGGDLTALQDGHSDDATTQTLAKPNLTKPNLNDKQKLAQNTLEKAQGVKSEKDKEEDKASLVAWITNKAQTDMALINKYNNNIEDSEQYGMKCRVFKFLKNKANQKIMNSDENQYLRKQLYSSLDWSEDKIKKFGTIINEIENNENKDLAKNILNAGTDYAQGNFEQIIDKIESKKDNLKTLTLQELKNIKSKLEDIDTLRQQWKDTINNIIADYEANIDGIPNNHQELLKYVSSKYGRVFKDEIPKTQALTQDIEKILK
ncbi:Antigen P35 (plasmid) [Borrelia nietonii YOR]|uniref:Antigen P35 n=1 Tax=Borrelia nietonii YOR TaxID=1293576 RepID=W5SAG8_9SPIR|nr:complement regulator-acquiring protein [Borrelia nietonii]AHH03952.1 Antigen P35 [Borrelia nietonii YOR]UPA09798.1 complement regulator-acquiring protein [Borrelia nietonii YOR]